MTAHDILRCGSKGCQFQNKFVSINNVSSVTAKRLYKCNLSPGSTYVNDHSLRVVYHITFNKWKLQHVGETCQNLNKRFSWYMFCFRNATGNSFCKILNADFSKNYCKDS